MALEASGPLWMLGFACVHQESLSDCDLEQGPVAETLRGEMSLSGSSVWPHLLGLFLPIPNLDYASWHLPHSFQRGADITPKQARATLWQGLAEKMRPGTIYFWEGSRQREQEESKA